MKSNIAYAIVLIQCAAIFLPIASANAGVTLIVMQDDWSSRSDSYSGASNSTNGNGSWYASQDSYWATHQQHRAEPVGAAATNDGNEIAAVGIVQDNQQDNTEEYSEYTSSSGDHWTSRSSYAEGETTTGIAVSTVATGPMTVDGAHIAGVADIDTRNRAWYYYTDHGDGTTSGRFHAGSGPHVWTALTGDMYAQTCDGEWDHARQANFDCVYGIDHEQSVAGHDLVLRDGLIFHRTDADDSNGLGASNNLDGRSLPGATVASPLLLPFIPL